MSAVPNVSTCRSGMVFLSMNSYVEIFFEASFHPVPPPFWYRLHPPKIDLYLPPVFRYEFDLEAFDLKGTWNEAFDRKIN